MKDLKAFFGAMHGLDEKSLQFLIHALEKNNLPGFDYIEFKQALAKLLAMNMDEMTAFKSAFATASTLGVTKEKLQQTALHYQGILNKEKAHFDNALKKKMHQRVEGKRQEVERLKQQVAAYHSKIAELQKQIDAASTTISQADEQIATAQEKITATKESFDFTHQSIMNQIKIDIENLERYL